MIICWILAIYCAVTAVPTVPGQWLNVWPVLYYQNQVQVSSSGPVQDSSPAIVWWEWLQMWHLLVRKYRHLLDAWMDGSFCQRGVQKVCLEDVRNLLWSSRVQECREFCMVDRSAPIIFFTFFYLLHTVNNLVYGCSRPWMFAGKIQWVQCRTGSTAPV